MSEHWTDEELRNVQMFGACELHERPVPRTFRLDRTLDPAGNLASETFSLICPACTEIAGEPREGSIGA